MRVGVVTVLYNSGSHIDGLLDSVESLIATGNVSASIVDNGSSDGCGEKVAQRLPESLVRGANVGFGAGCNRGVIDLEARGVDVDLVLFLNPDARIAPDQLAVLVDYLDAHPEVAIVGPMLRTEGHAIPSAGTASSLGSLIHPLLPGPTRKLTPSHVTPAGKEQAGQVGYVEGACFLVRRDALLRAGGFDERYFLFFEELDLSARLREMGLQTHLVAAASAEHAKAASRATLKDNGRSYFWASLWTYTRARHGKRAAAIWRSIAVVVWTLRALVGHLDRSTAKHWRTALAAAVRDYDPQPRLGLKGPNPI